MKSEQEHIKKATEDLAQKFGPEKRDTIKEAIGRVSKEAVTPKDMLKLNDQYVEGIYGQAYRLYNTGKYVEAGKLFQLLVMMNSMEPKYIMGLAACFHMLKEYKSAIETYMICSMLDPDSPIPHYHCSDCYINLGDSLSAIVSLDIAIKRAGDKAEYQVLRDRSILTLESLEKENTKKSKKQKTKNKA